LTLKEAKERLEKEMIKDSLEKYKGNLAKISRSLGIARSTIYDLIEKYGIEYEKGNKKTVNCN
jgi:two-component system NtrC family response regulator